MGHTQDGWNGHQGDKPITKCIIIPEMTIAIIPRITPVIIISHPPPPTCSVKYRYCNLAWFTKVGISTIICKF